MGPLTFVVRPTMTESKEILKVLSVKGYPIRETKRAGYKNTIISDILAIYWKGDTFSYKDGETELWDINFESAGYRLTDEYGYKNLGRNSFIVVAHADGGNYLLAIMDIANGDKVYVIDHDEYEDPVSDEIQLSKFFGFLTAEKRAKKPKAVDIKRLFSAARNDDVDYIVKYLNGGGICDIYDADQSPLLLHATHSDSCKALKELIKSGANINIVHKRVGWNAIMAAINAGNVNAVKCLVDAGADLTITDTSGRDAIGMADALMDESRKKMKEYMNKIKGTKSP
jgi:hypothetical protein